MEITECAEILKSQNDILLITHVRPDGDTLGSASALCHALRRMGKRAYLFPNRGVTENYMDYTAPYVAPVDFRAKFTVSVDVADIGLFPDGFNGPVDLCIDHHPSNSGYAAQTLLREKRAACGEIVLELLRAMCGDVDREEADLLYIAVSTDTGCFCYANTTAETLYAAAYLVEAGADNKGINKKIFRTATKERLALEGMVYTGMHQYRGGAVTIASVTLDMMERAGATESDCEDLSALAGKVKGTKVGVTIREMEPGSCKVSVRTGTEVNASAICAKFGGGGHAMAAGCSIEAGCTEAERLLVAAIDEVWK
jgi:phosphoesterase RecJ-like protein